ncbi:hypothetical protein HY642_07015 [Candidatus Woesearchaeota archaeon]|nr:hypothetical protein [Candidatus Woesearchaeota archaeon]
MTRHISAEDKQALLELVIEEIEKHKRGEVSSLTTNAELAELISMSYDSAKKCLRDLSAEYRAYRTRALKQNGGNVTGRKTKQQGTGIFGTDPTTGEKYQAKGGKIGGKIGGRKNKEHGTGIFGTDPITGEKYQSKGAKIGGHKCKEQGTGLFGTDPTTGEKYQAKGAKIGGKIVGRKCKEKGTGIFGTDPITGEKYQAKGGKIGGKIGGPRVAELHRRNAYHVESRFYASSQQEGAVALLLEKYIPDYRVEDGKNFQVRDNGLNNGGIDFLVDNEFLEWHPIVLYSDAKRRGDIPVEDYETFKAQAAALDGDAKKEFLQGYAKQLAAQYLQHRRDAVAQSGYAGTPISLATNTEELCSFLARHGQPPAFDQIAAEFKEKVKYVKQFKVASAKVTA